MNDPNIVDRCINANQINFYQDVFDDTPGAVTMQHRAMEPFSGTIEAFYNPPEFGMAWIKIKPAQNWAFPGAVAEEVDGKTQYFIYACPGPDVDPDTVHASLQTFNNTDFLNRAWVKGAAVIVSPWPDCPKEFYSLFFSNDAPYPRFSRTWSWEQLDGRAQVVAGGADQEAVPLQGTETHRPGLNYEAMASFLFPTYQCYLVSGDNKREERWTFSTSSSRQLPQTVFANHLSCSFIEFDEPQPLTWDIQIRMVATPPLQPLTPVGQQAWRLVDGWRTDNEHRWIPLSLTGNVSQVDEDEALRQRIAGMDVGVWGAGHPITITNDDFVSVLDRWHRYPCPFVNEDGYLTGVMIGLPPFEAEETIFEFTAG